MIDLDETDGGDGQDGEDGGDGEDGEVVSKDPEYNNLVRFANYRPIAS